MKQYKILFTSVGRRVELLQAFRNAADNLMIPLQIWGADISDTAPALYYCDRTVKVCRIKDANYIPQLLDLCSNEHIDALIPTIDTDLLVLSQNKQKFSEIGTLAVISDKDKIKLCRDKRYTADYFNSIGLHSPHPVDDYKRYEAGFPAFIKPKDGSSSISAYKVNNIDELKTYASEIPDYIVQPFIEGTEYTIDIFCDFTGNPIFITPRIRSAVRSGEVLKTEIREDDTMIAEMKKLVADYKPCGAITVQLIKEKQSGINYYIEINPRYGGGAPLSMKAGADSASALLRLLTGESLPYMDHAAADGAIFSRFDQCVCTNELNGGIRAVIFDLDDTLYSEKDYVKSGYNAVAEVLPQLPEASEKFWCAFESGKKAFDTVLEEAGLLSSEVLKQCIEIYRSHKPKIQLYKGVPELLEYLREHGVKIGVITDGRPEGQRNKIEALGLEKLVDSIIITDELGGISFRKPNDISFRIMQRKFGIPFGRMMYVGDNPSKDFIAPRQLGMQSVWFFNEEGLYAPKCEPCKVKTINKLSDLIAFL